MSSAATIGIIAGAVGTVVLLIVIIVGFILVRYANVDYISFPFVSSLYCVTLVTDDLDDCRKFSFPQIAFAIKLTSGT